MKSTPPAAWIAFSAFSIGFGVCGVVFGILGRTGGVSPAVEREWGVDSADDRILGLLEELRVEVAGLGGAGELLPVPEGTSGAVSGRTPIRNGVDDPISIREELELLREEIRGLRPVNTGGGRSAEVFRPAAIVPDATGARDLRALFALAHEAYRIDTEEAIDGFVESFDFWTVAEIIERFGRPKHFYDSSSGLHAEYEADPAWADECPMFKTITFRFAHGYCNGVEP